MFLVSDNEEQRFKLIESFKQENSSIALIMAAINFEWTIRRIMISLSKQPNKDIRELLKYTSGLERYKDVWKKALPNEKRLTNIISNWKDLDDQFKLRGSIVHSGNFKILSIVSIGVEKINKYTIELIEFSKSRGYDPYDRLKIKRRRIKK